MSAPLKTASATMNILSSLPAVLPPSKINQHQDLETVYRTLPVFLYNSLLVNEETRYLHLNLFEPRYRCLCDRIIQKQIPPYLLFVPNFQDYIPKPGDAAFVIHIEYCQPSISGQYSIRGKLVTTRRVIELSWREPHTNGLWFALTSPLQQLANGTGKRHNYECDALKFARNFEHNPISTRWNYSNGYKINEHIYRCRSDEGVSAAHILISNNHRDWHDMGWLACQVHVRSNGTYSTMHCMKYGSITETDIQNHNDHHVQKVKEKVITYLREKDAEHTMKECAISVLPPLPMAVSLLTLLEILFKQLFNEGTNKMNVDEQIMVINKYIKKYRLAPVSFFPMEIDTSVSGHWGAQCGDLYGYLPLATMTLQRKVRDVSMLDRKNAFPYLINEGKCGMLERYKINVNIKQGYSVNFAVLCKDVSIGALDAKRFLKNVARDLHWPVIRLLFAANLVGGGGISSSSSSSSSGADVSSNWGLNLLPLAVIRYIASFFLFNRLE